MNEIGYLICFVQRRLLLLLLVFLFAAAVGTVTRMILNTLGYGRPDGSKRTDVFNLLPERTPVYTGHTHTHTQTHTDTHTD